MHFLSSNSQKTCLHLCLSINSPFISIFFSILLADMWELFLVGHSTLISSTPSVASYKGYEVITRQLQEMDSWPLIAGMYSVYVFGKVMEKWFSP